MTLQEIIDTSEKIVFFGGAGVSTESGIPDFRSVDGIYNQKYKRDPEEIVSRTFFYENPKEFYEFYKDRMVYLEAKPNAAHIKLAELEASGKDITIVTQNIDGLHQAAGSKKVIELHGSIHRNHCLICKKAYDLSYIVESKGIPYCDCGGIVKPDVVLYEENLNEQDIKDAVNAIKEADTMIIGGTSLSVYPAAGFINYFRGKNLVVINRTETSADERAGLVIHDSIGKVFEEIKVR